MWLDASNSMAELVAINAAHDDRQIMPIRGTGGRMIVPFDLLADCGQGGYWADYCEWLAILSPTDSVPEAVGQLE